MGNATADATRQGFRPIVRLLPSTTSTLSPRLTVPELRACERKLVPCKSNESYFGSGRLRRYLASTLDSQFTSSLLPASWSTNTAATRARPLDAQLDLAQPHDLPLILGVGWQLVKHKIRAEAVHRDGWQSLGS